VATVTPQHFYYHADANGNVTALLSTNQQIAARYLYDPFGNTLSASGPLADVNLYRFSSKELHAASGLIYYLYRFYDANLQRWPNRDPFSDFGSFVNLGIEVLSVSADLNLFQFVRNEPNCSVDPWGLVWVTYGPDDTKDDSTFVCNGKGGLRPKLCPDDDNKDCGLDDCVKQHENSHIADVLKERPDICKGKDDNTGLRQTFNPDLWKSEIKAYNEGIACAQKLRPNASPLCQKDIDLWIKDQEKQRDKYVKNLKNWRAGRR